MRAAGVMIGTIAIVVMAFGAGGHATAQDPNLLLLYDEARFTVVNTGAETISLTGLAFVGRRVGVSVPRFEAASWQAHARSLAPGECVQLIYQSQAGAVRPLECSQLRAWRFTRLSDHHFWALSTDETAQFRVFQGSGLRGACPVGVGQCAVYVDPNPPIVRVSNLILYYTADLMVIFNATANTAPPLEGMALLPSGEDVPLLMEEMPWEPALGGWDGETIGAGQCAVLHSAGALPEHVPMRCEVVAQAGLEMMPWRGSFSVLGSVLGRTSACPAVHPELGTVCIVPQ